MDLPDGLLLDHVELPVTKLTLVESEGNRAAVLDFMLLRCMGRAVRKEAAEEVSKVQRMSPRDNHISAVAGEYPFGKLEHPNRALLADGLISLVLRCDKQLFGIEALERLLGNGEGGVRVGKAERHRIDVAAAFLKRRENVHLLLLPFKPRP